MQRQWILVPAFVAAVLFAQQAPSPQPPAGGRGGRGPATPPPELTAEQKGQYQSKIEELDGMVKKLRGQNVNEDLIADVDVFAKAGKWLLEFPQGFGNAQ